MMDCETEVSWIPLIFLDGVSRAPADVVVHEPKEAEEQCRRDVASQVLKPGDSAILGSCEAFARAGGRMLLCTRDRNMLIVAKGSEAQSRGMLLVARPSELDSFPRDRR